MSESDLDEIVRGVEKKQGQTLAQLSTPSKSTNVGSALKFSKMESTNKKTKSSDDIMDIDIVDKPKTQELPLPQIIESSEQSEDEDAEQEVEPDSIFDNQRKVSWEEEERPRKSVLPKPKRVP